MPGESAPAPPRAISEIDEILSLTISTLSGVELELQLAATATLQDLRDAVVREAETGVFAFRLLTDDGSEVDGNPITKLSEAGVADGARLVLITSVVRDYSRIKAFSRTLQSGRHPQGVLNSDHGELFICHYYGELTVYDLNYNLVRKTNLLRSPPTQMALAPNGDLLIAAGHQGGKIAVTDAATLSFKRWIGEDRGGFSHACGVAASADGRVFVAENHANRICVCDFESGQLLRYIGRDAQHEKGAAENPREPVLIRPTGISIVDERLLAVANRGANHVALISLDSFELVGVLGGSDSPANARLKQPNDVAVDPDGNLLVIDTGHERIAVFREDGMLVASVMPGFFKDFGNTYTYLSVNHKTGAISVAKDDEHRVVVLDPLFPSSEADAAAPGCAATEAEAASDAAGDEAA